MTLSTDGLTGRNGTSKMKTPTKLQTTSASIAMCFGGFITIGHVPTGHDTKILLTMQLGGFMKKPAEHYMPLFVGDFLAATADWDPDEKGAYLLLLMTQWGAGSLPNDVRKLARLHGYEQERFSRLWLTIGSKFDRCPDGRLRNDRLETHRAKNAAVQAGKSQRSKSGAAARWNASSNAKPMPNGMPNRCQTVCQTVCSTMPSDPIRSDPDKDNLLSSEIQGTTGDKDPDPESVIDAGTDRTGPAHVSAVITSIRARIRKGATS